MKKTASKASGERLRKWMKKTGRTQDRLVIELETRGFHVTQQAVSAWVRGVYAPKEATIRNNLKIMSDGAVYFGRRGA